MVQSKIVDANGTQLAVQSNTVNGTAELNLQVSGNNSTSYKVLSGHILLDGYYRTNYYTSCNGYYATGYDDYYNYQNVESTPTSPDIFAYYDFYGAGPECIRYVADEVLGQTTATIAMPHHLKIIDDTFSVDSNNLFGTSRIVRHITYQVVGLNNESVGTTQIKESDSSAVDTCSNSTPTYSTACASTNSDGTYIDTLRAGMPQSPSNSSCGYDIPDEKWEWCNFYGAQPLSLFDYYIHADRISVSGYDQDTGLPKDYYARPDGTISPN